MSKFAYNGPNFETGKPRPYFEGHRRRKGSSKQPSSEHSSRSRGQMTWWRVYTWAGGSIFGGKGKK